MAIGLPEEIVSTSDLQRKTKRMLDMAERRPVSVTRPNGKAITMVDRKEWNRATMSARWLGRFVEVALFALQRSLDVKPVPPVYFPWLPALNESELTELMGELSEAIQGSHQDNSEWEKLENIAHEWEHTAQALSDSKLKDRFENARKRFS